MKNATIAILAVLLTLLSGTDALSQGFEAGVKTGIGISTLSGWNFRTSEDENAKHPPLAGFLISMTGKYQFSELLGIQAELQFIQKGEGIKLEGNSTETSVKGKTRINYIVIPILANVSHSFGDILVYGQLGPYIGIGLSARSIVTEPTQSANEMRFKESGVNAFDFGLCIGAGAGYPLGPGKIILDLRYDFGFLDFYSFPEEIKTENYKAACNRTFGISLGYVIPLGQR